MSRWLSQVTDYLEQLDDQAEDYIEENINVDAGATGENLDSILAQRGLAASSEDDDVKEEDEAMPPVDSTTDGTVEPIEPLSPPPVSDETEAAAEQVDSTPPGSSGQPSSELSDKNVESKPMAEDTVPEDAPKIYQSISSEEENKPIPEAKEIPEVEVAAVERKEGGGGGGEEPGIKKQTPPPQPPPAKEAEEVQDSTKSQPHRPPAPKQVPPPPPPPPPTKETTKQRAELLPPAPPVVKDPNPALVKEAKEAQKEVRTLRRHMLTLNKQLESVEAEVSAQRKELEEAGGKFEKERAKAKEQRDKERKAHADELKRMQTQHEATLMDQKLRLEKQLSDMSQNLQDIEQTRMQEGGNWDKELQGAVEREQFLSRQNVALEDEKATMLAHISTLQSQQEALGDRIESLSHTADSAMEREREADERLDQALSVHAHQISQRQARESELERTIAELGAAMAAARNKESSRLADFKKGSDVSDTAGENTSQDSGLRVRLDMALHDLETAQANLDLERQRTETLQRELREVNGERAEEATNARMRQNKHDRQIAELTLQLSRMQQQSNTAGGKDGSDRKDTTGDDTETRGLKVQIKELSEEVLKAREKMSGYSSEISSMKSRLKGAVDRAEQAEQALEENLAVQSTDSYDRMERGSPASGNSMRRRGQRGSGAGSGTTSISSAMHLNKTERVGKAVDALDSFSVSTGKYLRYNPIARAAFIMYLLMLHAWTFVVIFFHAHNFEDMHRADLPHGPDALAQNQLGAGGQAVTAAIKAAAEAKAKQP